MDDSLVIEALSQILRGAGWTPPQPYDLSVLRAVMPELRAALALPNTVVTRLRPGDTAWFMHRNEAVNCEVDEIHVTLSCNCTPVVLYHFAPDHIDTLTEDLVFPSKAELLASL